MRGEVSFIEFGAGDTERARTFYEGVFNWKFTPGPNGPGFAIETPNVPGGMHGDDPGSVIVFYRVDDMSAAVEQVRELGGEVDEANIEGDEDSVAKFGSFRMCRDPEGGVFGLHRPPG